MDAEKIVKSSQEQAVGAWINYLNQVRLDRLIDMLGLQNQNLADAMNTIEIAFSTIKSDIIGRNRGGDKGMHGFIAEIAECGIGNARQQIIGNAPNYIWINDNGPADIMRGAEEIQQKFVQSGGHLSLRAITEHLNHYPDYLEHGKKYQIPKDHYDKIMVYLSMSESTANKLPTSTGEFSLRQWKEVHTFFESTNVDISKLEPSILEYNDVQQGAIASTFDKEKEYLKEINQRRRDAAYQESKPTLAEGGKAAAVGAVAEGLTSFCMAVIRKRRCGKKFSDFEASDWAEIATDSGKGSITGGIRGASIYLLTNYTATPAAVASALTTAAFGVGEQVHLFRNGTIDEVRFIDNSEILCLDAAVSALSSFVGQAVIPVPILGAIIGNTVGTMLYQIGKDNFSAKENKIINEYLRELENMNQRLDREYQECIEQLNRCYRNYMELLVCAFSPDVQTALKGSVELAKRNGVPADEIADSYDKIVSYFMN